MRCSGARSAACAGRSTWTPRSSRPRDAPGRDPPSIMSGLDSRLPPLASPDAKSRLTVLVEEAVRRAFPDAAMPAIELERPKNAAHGDFAANVALHLAKAVGRKPREVAEAIVKALGQPAEIAKTEIAGPGFINFTLATGARFAVVPEVLRLGDAFGRANAGGDRKIMVEFVSANPTGPLHVGHGRQAALGDAISTLLE